MRGFILTPICNEEFDNRIIKGDNELLNQINNIRVLCKALTWAAPNIATGFWHTLGYSPDFLAEVIDPTFEDVYKMSPTPAVNSIYLSYGVPAVPYVPKKPAESYAEWQERYKANAIKYLNDMVVAGLSDYKINLIILGAPGMNILTQSQLPKPQISDGRLIIVHNLQTHTVECTFGGYPVEERDLESILVAMRRN